MVDVFVPVPPQQPLDCVDPKATATQPSAKWLADYYGTMPTDTGPAPNVGLNGIDGLWWPAGKQLSYIDRQLYFDGSEVGASGGFAINVPDGELWRVNWIAVDWITNTGSTTKFFIIQVYDFNGTGFGYYVLGKTLLGADDGGSVSFTSGIQVNAPVPQLIQEPLPRPLFLYPNWQLRLQMYNGSGHFLNSLRADIERWAIITAPSGSPAPFPNNSNTPTTGGPYFAPAA